MTELREHFDANTAAPNNSRLGNVGGLIFRKVATTLDVLQKFRRSRRCTVHVLIYVCVCVCVSVCKYTMYVYHAFK